MARHADQKGVFIEVVEEYMVAANQCLHYRKDDSGYLGHAATLLLFCVIDALGKALIREQKMKLGYTKGMYILNHPHFGQNLTDKQIDQLTHWYRDQLAHAALIARGVVLSPGKTANVFNFSAARQPTVLYVEALFDLVSDAWKKFDKNQFKPSDRWRKP
jgi:hypothetical protein